MSDVLLKEDKNQFQKEQNALLKTMLDARYFNPWRTSRNANQKSLWNDANLEIFITNTCNQHCEYCYLVKYGDLYPGDVSPDHLLKNLRIVYQNIIDKNFHIPKIEFFTGEIWQTKFGLDVLDVTYEYLRKGMQVDWFLIASNFSFLLDKEQTQRIQQYIDKFKDIGHLLCFSASVDGKIVDEMERPLNSKKVRDDEFYENMFCFCKHNNFGFHPMVASQSAPYWIENYKWWYERLEYWDLDANDLMMLEVRNADWTPETMAAYNSFMDYLIDDFIAKKCNGDIQLFSNVLFNVRDIKNVRISGYIPWALGECDSFAGCTVATDLTLRLGDLAICPCHRTCYDKYLYGKIVLDDNDKMIDIEAVNPQMAIAILMCNLNTGIPKCDTCIFNYCCLKGCFGSQIEVNGDPMYPIQNVCDFFASKYSHLIEKYKALGVVDYLRTISPMELDYPLVGKFLNFVDNWEMWKKQCGKKLK